MIIHTTSAYFNSIDLNALQGVRVVNFNHTELPQRILNSSKLARADKSILTSAEYSQKTIFVTCFVGGSTLDLRQLNYDGLKSYIQDIEGTIRLRQGDTDVEYVGTLNGISKEYVGPNIKATLQFLCSNPIGRDTTLRALFPATTITAATYSRSFNVGGTFTARPQISITINSVTGATNKNLQLINASTGKGIKLTRTFANGDIISVNSDIYEVLVNSTKVDFSGQFPVLATGGQTLQYIDDFTTRNVTLSANYARQYS